MGLDVLKSYLDAWSLINNNTDQSVAAQIAGADPAIRLADVNSPNVHRGHEGIRHISAIARGKYVGAGIAWRDLLFDGRNWSIRWTMTGTRPDGETFAREGASAGSVGADGRVVEHTDYWSRGS